MKQYAIERNNGLEGAVVECHQDTQGRWRFSRWREDKNEGNHITTVQKVQQRIRDGLEYSRSMVTVV
jgi:mRNA guanylyltransferase